MRFTYHMDTEASGEKDVWWRMVPIQMRILLCLQMAVLAVLDVYVIVHWRLTGMVILLVAAVHVCCACMIVDSDIVKRVVCGSQPSLLDPVSGEEEDFGFVQVDLDAVTPGASRIDEDA